jgi:hypothetical protein
MHGFYDAIDFLFFILTLFFGKTMEISPDYLKGIAFGFDFTRRPNPQAAKERNWGIPSLKCMLQQKSRHDRRKNE